MPGPQDPHGPQFQGPQQPPPNWQPPVNVTAPQPPQKKPPSIWVRRLALVIPALLVGACAGSLGNADDATTAAPGTAPTVTITPTSRATVVKPGPTVTVTETAKAAEPEQSEAPAPKKTQAPAPKKTQAPAPAPKKTQEHSNGLTDEQQEAVGAAEDYLNFTAFSRQGLIEQLSSDAGSGFSKRDATVAVDSMDIDYNEQAAKAAKSYREFSHFSRQGLIQQLESDAGSGFTHAQAVYGADHSR